MRYLSLSLLALLFLHCKSRKTQLDATEAHTAQAFTGIVHVAENGCPYYLEIPKALNHGLAIDFTKVYPVNLKDGMKKKGLKVSFTYSLSKAMSPEGCGADAVVQIEQIEVIP